jgi:hypothetical protein
MVGKTRDDGRYWSPRRQDLEGIPRLNAAAVRYAIDGPSNALHRFIWRREGEDPVLTVRVGRYKPARTVLGDIVYQETIPAGEEWVSVEPEIPNPAGQAKALRVVRVQLPTGGRDLLLVCPLPSCCRPRRHLYAWAIEGYSLVLRLWQCRPCAGLRYASEGRGGWTERPIPWDPEVE